MLKQVFELDCGDLFIWDKQKDYLHQMTNDSPIADHIATLTDDKWRFHKPMSNKWNKYCDVKVVTISID